MMPHTRETYMNVLEELQEKSRTAMRIAHEAHAKGDFEVHNRAYPEAMIYLSLANALKRAIVHDDEHPIIKAFVGDEYTEFAEWRESRGEDHTKT